MNRIRPFATFLSALALLLTLSLGVVQAQEAPKSEPPAKTAPAEPAKTGEGAKTPAKPLPPVEVPDWIEKVVPAKYQQTVARGWEGLKVFVATNLLGAILIFILGRIVVSILCRVAGKIMERAKIEETLSGFLLNILRMLLLAFVVLAALQQLGVDTTSFAAIVAAAGFAIGFALQGSLGNFAAGVMLIMFKPFKKGDTIEAGGTKGSVLEVGVFVTKVKTPDNVVTIVPNSAITGGNITNFSAEPTRRVDMSFGCGYGDDLLAVKQFLIEEVAKHPKVLAEPAPAVFVSGLGDSSVDFAVRPWVKKEDYWSTLAELTESIKLGFDERGFNFPYPSRDVYLNSSAPATPVSAPAPSAPPSEDAAPAA